MESLKKQAAQRALKYLKDGMILGLGSGSPTEIFIELLADRLKNGLIKNILAVPTSRKTETLARRLGISLTTLSQYSGLDLTVDGADQVDKNF